MVACYMVEIADKDQNLVQLNTEFYIFVEETFQIC